RLDGLSFSGSHDPIPALVLCGAEKADQVLVAGRWRVIDGRALGADGAELDKEGLIAAHQEEARRLVAGGGRGRVRPPRRRVGGAVTPASGTPRACDLR